MGAPPIELKGNLFALPARVAESHCEQFDEHGIAYKKRAVISSPYELDAFIFYGRDAEDIRRIFGEVTKIVGLHPFTCEIIVQWGNRKISYFCGQTGIVRIVSVLSALQEGHDGKKIIEETPYPLIEETLKNFSRLAGGLNIDFYQEDRDATMLPLPDKDNLINIYPWNSPPGLNTTEYVYRAFDLLISTKGEGVLTFCGVSGRGEFIKDKENNLVQMLGNNWYLLFCVVDFFNQHTTIKILEQALASSFRRFQTLRRGARPSDKTTRLNQKEFIGIATNWLNGEMDFLKIEFQKRERAIKVLREELAAKERYCFDFRRILEMANNSLVKDKAVKSLPQQWRRIRSNSRIAKLALSGDSIHATTADVVIKNSELNHRLGAFVISISKHGDLNIWNLERLHPEGVPHPHINKEGIPCMGNAGSAIKEAITEHRYADAFDYLIRWLFDGYEENLALHKITEWPSMDNATKEPETVKEETRCNA